MFLLLPAALGCGAGHHDPVPGEDASPTDGDAALPDAGTDGDGGCVPHVVDPGPWEVDVVADGPAAPVSGARNLGFALDADEVAHVAFLRGEAQVLQYATNTGGVFVVDEPGPSGVDTVALVLDPAVVIAFQDQSQWQEGAQVTRRTQDGWAAEETLGAEGIVTGLAAGARPGELHVCLLSMQFPRDLLHGRRDEEGLWTTRTVAERVSVGKDWSQATCSLATAPDGTVHAGYIHGASGAAAHGVFGYEAWSTAPVEEGACELTSIAVGPDGVAHIVYTERGFAEDGDQGLRHAFGTGADWSLETIDAETPWTYSTSVAVDDAGTLHVAYTGPAVRYATNASGAWVIEDLDPGNPPNAAARVAVTPGGAPHVVYFAEDGALMHATRASLDDGCP
jgi:hypothetical protein